METKTSEYSIDFKHWFETLNDETKKQIHQLHKRNVRWNWVLALFILIWVLAALAIVNFPFVPVKLLGYMVIGLCIHGMANLMHECIHNNLFNGLKNNWLYGLITGMPALFSITAYKVNHLIHHKYTGTTKDPDELGNLTKNKFLIKVFFYLWLIVGLFMYLVHVPINGFRYGNKKERISILLEYAFMATVYGAIIIASLHFGKFDIVLHCWIIPMPFAGLLGNVRGWAEHMLTDKSHLLLNTRTVTSNTVFSFLYINLNYHLEHHLFPKIPWYNLPKLHTLLLPEYNKAGVRVYGSYLRFIWDAFKAGPLKKI